MSHLNGVGVGEGGCFGYSVSQPIKKEKKKQLKRQEMRENKDMRTTG